MVTAARIDPRALESVEIDRQVREAIKDDRSMYAVDAELIERTLDQVAASRCRHDRLTNDKPTPIVGYPLVGICRHDRSTNDDDFADLGHNPNWEQPEAVASAINLFLKSNR